MSGAFDYAQEDRAIAKWMKENTVECARCDAIMEIGEERWDAWFDENGEFVDALPLCPACWEELNGSSVQLP